MPVEKRSEKRIKKNYFLNLKKKFILGEKITFFNLCHPQATHECLQKNQPFQSSRLAGQREHLYECLVLLYRLISACFMGKF